MKSNAKSYFAGSKGSGKSGGYKKIAVKVGTDKPKGAGIPTDGSASMAMSGSHKRAGANVKVGHTKTWC